MCGIVTTNLWNRCLKLIYHMQPAIHVPGVIIVSFGGLNPICDDVVSILYQPDLACRRESCGKQMSFLLQIYCPLDEPSDAFHRVIYLFCCTNDTCVTTEPNKALLALRCQLPRQNPFYANVPGSPQVTEVSGDDSLDAQDWGTKLCALCGCRAVSACTGCKVVRGGIATVLFIIKSI